MQVQIYCPAPNNNPAILLPPNHPDAHAESRGYFYCRIVGRLNELGYGHAQYSMRSRETTKMAALIDALQLEFHPDLT